jgi:hypothetical protein
MAEEKSSPFRNRRNHRVMEVALSGHKASEAAPEAGEAAAVPEADAPQAKPVEGKAKAEPEAKAKPAAKEPPVEPEAEQSLELDIPEDIVTNVTVVPHKEPEPEPKAATPAETKAPDAKAAPEKAAADKAKPSGQRQRSGKPRSGSGRRRRRVRLRISKINPWSVMKTALLFSITVAIIMFTVVAVVWLILQGSGALKNVQSLLDSIIGSPEGGGGTVQISSYLDTPRVLGFAGIISVLNVILMTAIATLMAYLYNISAALMGGLEVTLAED